MVVFLPSTTFAFSFLVKKKVFLEYLVLSGNKDVLCYLMASHSNPMAVNLRIASFIVAFLRARGWVVHYASKQFGHLLYEHKRNQEGWALQSP